ncbi:MAG: hypothetical protein ACE5Q3_15560 [Alphaproteobacteria bacterium]
MNLRTYCRVTAALLALIAVTHLVRVVLGWTVAIGAWSVPMWVSWVALVIAAILSYFGFRLGARARR